MRETEDTLSAAIDLRRKTYHFENEQFLNTIAMLKDGRGSFGRNGGVTLGSIDEGTKDLINEISWRLLAGTLSEAMVLVLLELLDGLPATHRRKILGLQDSHRSNTKRGKEESATNTFVECMRIGMSQESAEREAYDAYFANRRESENKAPGAFAVDQNKPGNRYKNKADQTMATVIRKLLIKKKLIETPRRGRPKSKIK